MELPPPNLSFVLFFFLFFFPKRLSGLWPQIHYIANLLLNAGILHVHFKEKRNVQFHSLPVTRQEGNQYYVLWGKKEVYGFKLDNLWQLRVVMDVKQYF